MKLTKSDIKIALLFAFILLSKLLSAQDSHFSHTYTMPMQINPANTSLCKADWQLTNIYRNQWKNVNIPFKTLLFSGEKQFYALKQNFGGGFLLTHENSGALKYSVTQFLMSGSVHKNYNKNSVHFGLQSGFVSKAISAENITRPDQYDNTIGEFNSEMYSNDDISNDNTINLIFNAGAVWKYSSKVISPSLGFAYYNFNNPNYRFIDNSTSKFSTRKTFHSNVEINISERISSDALIMYMNQQKASEMLVGSVIKYHYNTKDKLRTNDIYVGCFLRTGYERTNDALIFTGGIELKNVMISLAYDRSISSIKYLNGNSGAFEIMLKYKGIYTNMDRNNKKCVSF